MGQVHQYPAPLDIGRANTQMALTRSVCPGIQAAFRTYPQPGRSVGAKPTRRLADEPNFPDLPPMAQADPTRPASPLPRVAANISASLAKKAISATVNGAHWDLQWPVEADAEIAIHTMKDEAPALELIRHDLAHVMARAVQEIWPEVRVTIGPGDREWLVLRFRPGGALHPRGSRPDRCLRCARSSTAAITVTNRDLGPRPRDPRTTRPTTSLTRSSLSA